MFFGRSKGFLQIFARLFQGAESIVVGLDGLPVFVDGAFALASNIENLAQLYMAPDLRPARIAVTVNGRAVGICRRLIVSLQEENLRDAVVGQRTVLVLVERLVELRQRAGKIALLLQRLPRRIDARSFTSEVLVSTWWSGSSCRSVAAVRRFLP